MLRVEKRKKKVVWIVSALLGTLIVLIAVFVAKDSLFLNDFILLAVVVALIPSATVEYMNHRWKRRVDDHLPDIFRSVVQAQQTGMTLPQALEEASKRDYGPLTPELRRLVSQMSWSLSFEEALEEFQKRVDTPMVRKTVPIIVEASRSGGHVEKVFAPMGDYIQNALNMKKERSAQTRPYIVIIYIAFFVFVFTIVLLFKTFFLHIDSSPIIGVPALTTDEAWRIFFHMSSIQAFFGGLVAGKMGEDAISAGLKHSVILMVIGYLALRVIAW